MNFRNLPPYTFILGEIASFLWRIGSAFINSLPISIPIIILLLFFKKTYKLKLIITVVYTAIGYKFVKVIAGNHFGNLYESGHSETNARIMSFFILFFLTSLFPAMSLLVFKFLNKQKWWKYALFLIPFIIVHIAWNLQFPH